VKQTGTKKIVRAIDLGFGNTKSSLSASHDPQGIQLSVIPSVANPVRSGMMASGLKDDINVQRVLVSGTEYEIGPDARIAQSSTATQILHEEYIRQSQYMALSYGAMLYMNVDTIDFLVLGLPVRMMHLSSELKTMMIGKHEIQPGRFVEVKDCGVLAQPQGAMSYYGLSSKPENMQNLQYAKNLLIDCGYFTVDWILSEGFSKPDDVRSGSHNSGMSSLLAAVCNKIASDFNIPGYSEFNDVDTALRTGVLHIYGKQVDMSPYYELITQVAQNTINAIKNSVGDGRNIQNIMLSGGSAFAFSQAIKAAFPHDIIVIDNPVGANVMGFQLRGEMKFV